MINIGDKIRAYPMLVSREVVTKFGKTHSGIVKDIIHPGESKLYHSNYTIYVIEKSDGSRMGISERQL